MNNEKIVVKIESILCDALHLFAALVCYVIYKEGSFNVGAFVNVVKIT